MIQTLLAGGRMCGCLSIFPLNVLQSTCNHV